jgi:hypothetical protein
MDNSDKTSICSLCKTEVLLSMCLPRCCICGSDAVEGSDGIPKGNCYSCDTLVELTWNSYCCRSPVLSIKEIPKNENFFQFPVDGKEVNVIKRGRFDVSDIENIDKGQDQSTQQYLPFPLPNPPKARTLSRDLKKTVLLCRHISKPNSKLSEIELVCSKHNIVNFQEADEEGFPPLYYSLLLNKLEISEWLIARNANVNQIVNGKSLLYHAIKKNKCVDSVKLLIVKGADVTNLDLSDLDPPLIVQYWLKRASESTLLRCDEIKKSKLKRLGLDKLGEIEMSLIGQQMACRSLYKKLANSRLNSSQKSDPKPLVLLFVGPPGHGKVKKKNGFKNRKFFFHRQNCQKNFPKW